MEAHRRVERSLSQTGHTILIVDAEPETLAAMTSSLRRAGHRTIKASTFHEAKQLLASDPPDLLITEVRLGAFNGLHLALRRHHDQPGSASIITSAYADRMLEEEACAINAPYLVKPVEPAELLALVEKIFHEDTTAKAEFRRWPRRRIAGGGFRAALDSIPALLLDVSDYGLCLQIPSTTVLVPSSFTVNLPAFGLSLAANSIWKKADDESGAVKCGAALVLTDPDTIEAWRCLVDALIQTTRRGEGRQNPAKEP
jgi:CheY-like chemotaxis protein